MMLRGVGHVLWRGVADAFAAGSCTTNITTCYVDPLSGGGVRL